MKLTEIQIDCHGLWRNLTLSVHSRGLSVIYGPNEGGKTTLREFITGVLFGFSRGEGPGPTGGRARLPAAGSLQIEDSEGSHRIHRAAVGAPAGDACLIADDAARPAASALDNWLKGIDQNVFERVYAVGLRELSELNSLSGDDVARHLFGLAQGRAGGRILEAARRIDERRSKLIGPLQQDGALVRLFERHDELTARLHELGRLHDRHAEWSLRRDQLEGEIDDLRKRLAGTGAQLRGHEFLERAWGPWDRIRECHSELDALPHVADFPDRGLARLEKLESEIAAAAESRDHLLGEVRQLRDKALHFEKSEWRTSAAAMQTFVDERDGLIELERRVAGAAKTAAERQGELAAACEKLGPDWSAARLEAADVSAAAERQLSGTAGSYLAALRRGKAIRRKCRRLAAACRDLKESLAESLHDLDGRGIDAALADARARIGELNTLAGLQQRETLLAQARGRFDEDRRRIAPQLDLPRWVYLVLGLFAFMGVILAGWGLVAGVATSGIAGAIYAMLGITCGGLAWGLKIQYEGDARLRLAEVEAASAAADLELGSLRLTIRQATGGAPAVGDHATRLAEAHARIGELIDLAANQRRLSGGRRKLAVCRKKLATARREVATARHNWHQLLLKLGFPESLSVDEALAAWQLLSEAAERLSVWQQARREFENLGALWEGHRRRIVQLAQRIAAPAGEAVSATIDEPATIVEILDGWRQQLAAFDRRQGERREQRAALRLKRREARSHDKRARGAKLKRNALFVQGGAADRDEFEERARSFARRTFLEDQRRDAERDLDAACAAHTDLALVEEDLERFEPVRNADCIEMLRMEIADLESDLERAFEHLSRVKHEIESLENDNQATSVRFELRQVEEQLRGLAREWLACETAARVVDDMRREFESAHQPPVLAAAAKMFSRLTGRRYRRVWTPLGERRLIVDDDSGRSFPVQALSRATREQLLLAVRLAVVGELAGQGVSLPMILDDVIVNFDAERAAATVDLLLELAEQGQQFLFFTCHSHLAQLFASRGVEPIWLPGPAAAAAAHEEQRLAG